MFDIGWSELLLIAVVAVVVIGPRDLPNAMRSMGKTIRGVRRMASDFQAQFNDAIREAELDDLRREVTELRDTARGLVSKMDVSSVARDELEGIRQSIDAKEAAIETKTAEGEYAAADAVVGSEPMLALPEPPALTDEPMLPLGPTFEEAVASTADTVVEAPPEPAVAHEATAAVSAEIAERPIVPRRDPAAEPPTLTPAVGHGRP
jgi:sec-independent protein translocase protein TatB